jgi:hypothetical protein
MRTRSVAQFAPLAALLGAALSAAPAGAQGFCPTGCGSCAEAVIEDSPPPGWKYHWFEEGIGVCFHCGTGDGCHEEWEAFGACSDEHSPYNCWSEEEAATLATRAAVAVMAGHRLELRDLVRYARGAVDTDDRSELVFASCRGSSFSVAVGRDIIAEFERLRTILARIGQ